MIKVLHPGIYCSIQDQGRVGSANFGVPISGAMDRYSFELANILLKNRKTDAVIEVTYGMAKFEFNSPTFICLTGADFSPRIDDQPVEMMTVYQVFKGSILSFGKRNYGARTYVAVQGGIQSEIYLQSRSFFKGITPNFRLSKGDELPILKKQPYENKGFSKVKILDPLFSSQELQCSPGPEFYQLSDKQKQRLAQPFTISENSNRVGYRLEESLKNSLKPILTSPVLPGTVQLTPSGTLIVLMQDAQVTGGYPRVLQLNRFYIDVLSQKMMGDKFSFKFKKE